MPHSYIEDRLVEQPARHRVVREAWVNPAHVANRPIVEWVLTEPTLALTRLKSRAQSVL
jgi:hypothetical protein